MTPMKQFLFAMTAIIGVSSAAFAVDTVAPTSAERAQETTSVTQEFVRNATFGNMFEIESSKLALQRSKDKEVQAFAKQMIADHTKAGNEMKIAVKKAKIDPTIAPTEMDDKHVDIITDLKKSSAADFDEDYIDAQEDAHEETVSLFEKYAKDGDNDALKAFAAKTLPTLKAHKVHVERLDDKE